MATNYTLAQLMVTAAAREIVDGEVVFVGMRLPLLGFQLAKSAHAPRAVGIFELGIVRETAAPEPILTMGDLPNLFQAQWLADTADLMGLLQRGLVDVSFIGGAQIDRYGNLNTSYVGDLGGAFTRLPGSGGRLRPGLPGAAAHHHYETRKAALRAPRRLHHLAWLRRWSRLARESGAAAWRADSGDHHPGDFAL